MAKENKNEKKSGSRLAKFLHSTAGQTIMFAGNVFCNVYAAFKNYSIQAKQQDKIRELEKENSEMRQQNRDLAHQNRRLGRDLNNANYQLGKKVAERK